MARGGKYCLVGQVLVDVTLSKHDETKLRLGGIMHAARAMWALGVPYSIAYTAPSYLHELITDFAKKHGVDECICIGEIDDCPNVILIPEPTEAGSQGYEYLLRESQRPRMLPQRVTELGQKKQLTDFLIFPGGFDLSL